MQRKVVLCLLGVQRDLDRLVRSSDLQLVANNLGLDQSHLYYKDMF